MAEKPTLVILPGWGGSHETWQEFIALAKQKYDVVCIDLPCFGSEPCPSTVWGVAEYAEFVMSKLKIQMSNVNGQMSKVVLLGHSFGGQVATYVTVQHPELIAKLILSGAAVFRPARRIRRFIYGGIASVGKLLFRLPVIEDKQLWVKEVLYRAADSPDYAKTSGIQKEIFKKVIREDLRHLLAAIRIPTLVVWGAWDAHLPASDAKKIAGLLPQASLVIVPRGRHGLHRQDPSAFWTIIRRFIESETHPLL